MNEHLALLIAACLLDALLGDPLYRWHPVRWIGSLSLAGERVLFALGLDGRLGGVLHWILVVGSALGGWFAVHAGLAVIHPGLALLWDLYLAYSLLCLRDLLEHGWRILHDLQDPAAARRHLSSLVGRDTAPLETAGIVRATIESLSENLTDATLTPLWALCLFGLPGLILVKAVSTLDSMVGYKNARYERFGWAGARSDDLAHWIPARLSVVLIAAAAAVLRLHPWLAIRSAWRDHGLLASPNSGWSEAACAGALRVRLLGPIWYQGRLVNETFMGDPDWPADLGTRELRQALDLLLVSTLFAVLLGLAMAFWRHGLVTG